MLPSKMMNIDPYKLERNLDRYSDNFLQIVSNLVCSRMPSTVKTQNKRNIECILWQQKYEVNLQACVLSAKKKK